MGRNPLIEYIESKYIIKRDVDFKSGDTVCVHLQIREGEKVRTQSVTGIVVFRRGSGIAESFAIYKISAGVGFKKTFLINSPDISGIDIVRRGVMRRANASYIMRAKGRAARVKEKIVSKAKKPSKDSEVRDEEKT